MNSDRKKYIIIEGKLDGKYNATNKAREDIIEICKKNMFETKVAKTEKGVFKNKLLKPLQFLSYYYNSIIFENCLSNLEDDSIVIIQYPLTNTVLSLERIIRKHSKRLQLICLIHDLDSLRVPKGSNKASRMRINRIEKEDKTVIKEFNHIVCHNKIMKTILIKYGVNPNKIVELGIFDYLCKDVNYYENKKNNTVAIAGNLSKDKAQYIYDLGIINETSFILYGVGFDKNKIKQENLIYNGVFRPEDLIKNLDGSFGLVWDGTSINSLEGEYGKYLKYNNPHKASMYLVACKPIITSKESAIANFVVENELGFVVESLKEIPRIINEMSDEKYRAILNNVKNVSKNISKGYFFENALKKIGIIMK